MSERPILFSGPMIRAILSGSKTQTRRIVKGDSDDAANGALRCPYGAPGDTLWVRETHAITKGDYWAEVDQNDDDPRCMEDERVLYAATPRVGLRRWVGRTAPAPDAPQGRPHAITYLHESSPLENGPAARVERWRPSIHMPRWASRLTLRVESVRVERLWDITEDDAIEEGCTGSYDPSGLTESTARDDYSGLWDSINAKRAPWASNPWVWVVTFSRVSQ